jgi:hypothetical protein
MRTLVVNFEANSVSLACGAPGLVALVTFAAEPVQPVLDRLAELFAAHEPEQVLATGTGGASAAVVAWFGINHRRLIQLPDEAIQDMADALASGATRLTFSGETADYGQRPSSEKTALAALELHHRLTTRPADQVRGRRVYK